MAAALPLALPLQEPVQTSVSVSVLVLTVARVANLPIVHWLSASAEPGFLGLFARPARRPLIYFRARAERPFGAYPAHLG